MFATTGIARTRRSVPAALGFVILLLATAASAAEGGIQLWPELPWEQPYLPVGWNLVILVVLFLALVLPVSQLLFKPVLQVLDERADRIEGTRARAARLEEEAAEMLTRYQDAIRDVRARAESERREALDTTRSQGADVTRAAREIAEEEIARARTELSAILERTRDALRDEAERLAGDIGERVLGRPL